MRAPGGDQLKIKGKYNGISQEAGTLLLPNFLTEMNCGSDNPLSGCQGCRGNEVKESQKVEMVPNTGILAGAYELLCPQPSWNHTSEAAFL